VCTTTASTLWTLSQEQWAEMDIMGSKNEWYMYKIFKIKLEQGQEVFFLIL